MPIALHVRLVGVPEHAVSPGVQITGRHDVPSHASPLGHDSGGRNPLPDGLHLRIRPSAVHVV